MLISIYVKFFSKYFCNKASVGHHFSGGGVRCGIRHHLTLFEDPSTSLCKDFMNFHTCNRNSCYRKLKLNSIQTNHFSAWVYLAAFSSFCKAFLQLAREVFIYNRKQIIFPNLHNFYPKLLLSLSDTLRPAKNFQYRIFFVLQNFRHRFRLLYPLRV